VVAGPDAAGEPVDGVVGLAHEVLLVVEGEGDQYGSEDLLLARPGVTRQSVEHGGEVVGAAGVLGALGRGTSAQHAGAFLAGQVDVRGDPVAVRGVHQRGDLCVRPRSGADAQLRHAGDQFADEFVVEGARHEQP